jgi:CDP-glycerol glycerophosphotransferase (TagB/SpsB family)
MGSGNKKRLLLLITNSYAATNVIHSGLIKQLAGEYNIQLISNLIGDRELNMINTHFDVQMQQIRVSLSEEGFLLRFLRQLEKAVFFNHFNIETQKVKDKQLPTLSRFVTNYLLNFLKWTNLSARLLRVLRQNIIRISRYNRRIGTWNLPDFDGVISTSPLDIRENIIVNYLKNTPSLAIVISWDNLTSKGIINADHDCVLVWNEFMADEYDRFYRIFNISKQKLFITGIPRFDLYYKPLPTPYSPESFRKQFNIPTRNKLILFATSALNHCPHQADIVEHLLDYTSKNPSITVLVRCHFADDYRKYSRFKNHPSFRIWHSTKTPLNSLPELDVLQSLASMLKSCNVCIQIASTIRLEAAICNKPCICIAYDGDEKPSDSHSVKRFYSYSHQIPLNNLELDQFVYSKTELFQTLDQLLEAIPKIDNAGKLQKFVHQTRTEATSLTMKHIKEWLS